MTHALNPGTPVAIAPGVRHAALALPLDGWHGRIRARVTLPDDDGVEDDGVEDDGVYYDVAWDSVTLAERPFELWLYLADHDLAWDGWVFAADQLAAAAARDTAAAADEARQRMGAALGERGADKRMGHGGSVVIGR
ncbi:MAG: hypothetical protein KC425_05320, partial [Anaerolineales bacterium]|nr:hypothetical protein [Anaerolineales bacterium]